MFCDEWWRRDESRLYGVGKNNIRLAGFDARGQNADPQRPGGYGFLHAVVMGAEKGGLRRLTVDNCDIIANLPMQGQVQSLNVSVATGICLYEVVRQRQFA